MSTPIRLQHVPGAWLLSSDLSATSALPSARLAQHHTAAHRTWGCSAGLIVTARSGQVTVTRGCAVDRCGRMVVLAATDTVPLRGDRPVAVVLRACGQGPDGAIALREAGQLHDVDIPLATVSPEVDGDGSEPGRSWQIWDGDGHRQWLRRPGPIRRLAGIVARGTPVTGRVAAWQVEIDLTGHRLPDVPIVVATAAGPSLEGSLGATVEVRGPTAEGFVLAVRHRYPAPSSAATSTVHTAPHALSWLALVPAERPRLPSEEWA